MEPLLGEANGSEGGGGMPDGRGGVRRRGEARMDAAGVEQHDVGVAARRRAGVVAVVGGLAVAALCAVGVWAAPHSSHGVSQLPGAHAETAHGLIPTDAHGEASPVSAPLQHPWGLMLACADGQRDWAWPPAEDATRGDGGIAAVWPYFADVWVEIARVRAENPGMYDPCDPREVVFTNDLEVFLTPGIDIDDMLSQLAARLRPSAAAYHLRFR